MLFLSCYQQKASLKTPITATFFTALILYTFRKHDGFSTMNKDQLLEEQINFLRITLKKCQEDIKAKGLTISTGYGANKKIDANPTIKAYTSILHTYTQLLDRLGK